MFSDVFAQIKSRLNPGHSRTGIHDPSARVAALSTINKGIDASRQFLCSLLTHRNALMPISLIPPEILARVFDLLMLEEPPLFGRRNLGWIKVTHVCRHWRQVALDDSSLWARIWGIQTNTKWIPEMLARAKNAPLDIKLNADKWTSPETLLMIPPHLFHTRQLRLYSLYTPHFDHVREIFSSEAPALEHFELTVTTYSPIDCKDLGLNVLFKGHAPRLRAFSLSRLVIPWSLIPRGQLTQLKIAYPDEGFYSPGDLNQLVDLLVNCPALEILTLESCLPSQLAEFPHDRTIHLSHLSHLHLRGPTSHIMNMLKVLKIPSSTTLHLDCISNITSINDNPEGLLLSVISAQFQSPGPVEFKSFTVALRNTTGSGSLKITASTSPSTLRNLQIQNLEGDIVSNAELVLSFVRLSIPGRSTDLFERACKVLPISNLEYISLSATHIKDINWVELFGCCPNVTAVEAIGNGTSGLVRALTAPMATNSGFSKKGRKRKRDNRERSTLVQPDSTVTHAHAAIFPQLELLRLTELNFAEPKHLSGILFDVFERGLQQRMAASAPLKLLHIRDCEISPNNLKQMNDMGKLVQDFRWDTIEIDEDFDESPFDPGLGYWDQHGWDELDDSPDGW